MFGSAAAAREIPSAGLTAQEVVAWLQAGGYRASLETDKDGAQHVASGAEGYSFDLYLLDCKAGRCGSLQFAAGFNLDAPPATDRINEWNREHRWARAYLAKDKSLWAEYDIDIAPGGTYELLDDELSTWAKVLSAFGAMFGDSKST